MTRIVLTRHGHVEGIAPERFRGRADVPLTENGRAQARALGARIARDWTPKAIYSSPMGRCLQTAAEVARACDGTVSSLQDLNDFDYGQFQWKTIEEIKLSRPEFIATWRVAPQLVCFPNGEALQDVVARAGNVVRLMRENHAGDTVVLVAHDAVNRALLLQLLDQPLSAYWRLAQSPCAINELTIDGLEIRVQRMNDTAHLTGIPASSG